MTLEDPFFVVKDEVFKALNKTRGLYLHWRELGDASGAEVDWTTTELRNSLRSIEWDLEDLEDTIYIIFFYFIENLPIVEKNPNKFKIDNKELLSRRHFIDATRDEVKLMKEKMSFNRNRDKDITARQPLLDNPSETNNNHNLNNNNNSNTNNVHFNNNTNFQNINNNSLSSLTNSQISSASVGTNLAYTLAGTMSSSAASAAARHSGTKYSKLENSLDSPSHYVTLDSPSHKFIGESVSVQQRILQSQDDQLGVIGDSIGTLKTVSRQIGVELDEQAVMLDDFSNELETTESKLDTTIKKVARVLHMNNDNRQWIAIAILSALLLIVIILFILL